MATSNKAFPWRQLGVLSICRLAEPVAFVSICAYAFVMVQEIHGEKDASFYAGLLVSAFAAAEACTAWIWGGLSDRFGRKPIILVALAGTALSSLIFGFAKNYWIALLARVVGGALNGNVAVMQTMVAEIVTRPEHEPKAYALQPFMWSLGSIAGSALGGYAAQPAKFHPGYFSQDGIFGKFPYLLPNLIAVGIIIIAFVLGWAFLEETNPALKMKADQNDAGEVSAEADETTPLQRERHDSVASKKRAMSQSQRYVGVQVPIPVDPSFDLRRASIGSVGSATLFKKSAQHHALLDSAVVEDDNSSSTDESSVKVFNRGVIAWTVALWLLCYHQMAFNSLLPIYLLDDPRSTAHGIDLRGGLGLTLPDVGTVLAVNSVISLLVQGIIFPIYVQKLGVYAATISLFVVSPFVYILTPSIRLLQDPKAGVYLVMILQSLAATMAYPTVLILLKNACPSTTVLGKVNGVAMSGCSGARTIAPPVVGIVYSSLGSAAGWWSAAVVAMIALIEIMFAPRPPESTEKLLDVAARAEE